MKSPISKVAAALRLRNEGLGLRATGQVLESNKRTISLWEMRFANQKKTLMLCAFCHEFLSLNFESDETYTTVGKKKPPMESFGWTAIIMERASRFFLNKKCGEKDADLFKSVMHTVARYIEQTVDLTFISDGERRYGNMLYYICSEKLLTVKLGRPSKVLPKGVRVRIKNKGKQNRKRGPKRAKYESLQKDHPETDQDFPESKILSNRVEAQNSALRKKSSAFRRRTEYLC